MGGHFRGPSRPKLLTPEPGVDPLLELRNLELFWPHLKCGAGPEEGLPIPDFTSRSGPLMASSHPSDPGPRSQIPTWLPNGISNGSLLPNCTPIPSPLFPSSLFAASLFPSSLFPSSLVHIRPWPGGLRAARLNKVLLLRSSFSLKRLLRVS